MRFVWQGLFLFVGVWLIRGLFEFVRYDEVNWGPSAVYAFFFSVVFTFLLWLMRRKDHKGNEKR